MNREKSWSNCLVKERRPVNRRRREGANEREAARLRRGAFEIGEMAFLGRAEYRESTPCNTDKSGAKAMTSMRWNSKFDVQAMRRELFIIRNGEVHTWQSN